MRITHIQIDKLFGLFDHSIPLNQVDRITILHGLNGLGKTTILRLIDDLFNGALLELFRVPFQRLRVTFDDRDSIEIEKHAESNSNHIVIGAFSTTLSGELNEPDIRPSPSSTVIDTIGVSVNKDGHKTVQVKLFEDDVREKLWDALIESAIPMRRWMPERVSLSEDYGLAILWEQIRSQSSRSELEHLKRDVIDPLLPEELRRIRKHVSVFFVETERLAQLANNAGSRSSQFLKRKVESYSEEVAELVRGKLAEYGKKSHALERSFPIRLVERRASKSLPL